MHPHRTTNDSPCQPFMLELPLTHVLSPPPHKIDATRPLIILHTPPQSKLHPSPNPPKSQPKPLHNTILTKSPKTSPKKITQSPPIPPLPPFPRPSQESPQVPVQPIEAPIPTIKIPPSPKSHQSQFRHPPKSPFRQSQSRQPQLTQSPSTSIIDRQFRKSLLPRPAGTQFTVWRTTFHA